MSDLARVERVYGRLVAIGLDSLADGIAKRWHVTVAQILGRDRRKGPSAARHALWFTIKNNSGRDWSWPEIGDLFEVDHTTVMSGVEKHRRQIADGRVPADPQQCAGSPEKGASCT